MPKLKLFRDLQINFGVFLPAVTCLLKITVAGF